MAEHQRTERVPERKRQQISTHVSFGHAIKPHQDQRVSKKDRVIEERLRCHERQAKK